MLLENVLHFVFAYFIKPQILRLQADYRRHFTTVGAVGFDNFYVFLQPETFTQTPESFAQFFAAALFAFAAGAHVNYLFRGFVFSAHFEGLVGYVFSTKQRGY